ncbi:MAG TPA: hypothetical protein VGB77_16175 [Abditibacteriaceae bacterium]
MLDFAAGNPRCTNDFGLMVAGLALIALGDMGSKLSNLRSDFDFFLAQLLRPPARFLKPTPNDESE